jgi:hypothetical protein
MPSAIHVPRVVVDNRPHPSDSSHDRRLAHHGYFYSWKRDELLPYRGTLAFDFLVSAEANPEVLSIGKSRRPFHWWDGAKWCVQQARYAVTLRAGADGAARLVEALVMTSVEKKKRSEDLRRLKIEARHQGRSFQVFTEKEIRVEPRLTNCKLILDRARRGMVPDEDLNLIRQVAYGTQTFSLNELVQIGVLPYARAYTAALNMVASGELDIELDRVIDGDSRLGRACHE